MTARRRKAFSVSVSSTSLPTHRQKKNVAIGHTSDGFDIILDPIQTPYTSVIPTGRVRVRVSSFKPPSVKSGSYPMIATTDSGDPNEGPSIRNMMVTIIPSPHSVQS